MSESIITHNNSSGNIDDIVEKIRQRIKTEGDKDHVTVERQLSLLTELAQFELGRFLLINKGVNGFWTHYILTHLWYGRKTGKNRAGKPLTKLERFLLDRLPTLLATQQRFTIFLAEIQKSVKNGAVLASIPAGLLGELLYLDLKHVDAIQLVGIDYDEDALKHAKALAENMNLAQFVELHKTDAWQLNLHDKFDLISSNGLNVYEPDDNKVIALYQQFFNALKAGGKLVTSFLTPPPGFAQVCEWQMHEINQDDLLLQRILFSDIIQAKWQCFRSTEQTKKQLKLSGFKNIQFIYDTAHLFPTVTALKE